MQFFNWTISKESGNIAFSQITFQRTWDDQFVPMKDSLIVHAKKHPEVLSTLGWKQDELIVLSKRQLRKEYLRSCQMILSHAKSTKAEFINGRNFKRFEVLVPFQGNRWLLVLEQQTRNLGNKKFPYAYFTKDPMIVTCYSKDNIRGYSMDPNQWFLDEYIRLAAILFDESEEYFEEKYSVWINYIDCDFITWKDDVTNIFIRTLNTLLDRIIEEFQFPHFEIETSANSDILDELDDFGWYSSIGW